MKIDKPLWEYTRDLHHACEAHDVGGAMSTGKPPSNWYCAWLNALLTIHSKIDPYTPKILHRTERLRDDIITMCYQGTGFFAYFNKADEYVEQLDNEKKIAGAIYVLTGAHLMGGEIMRRRLEGFPTYHLEWEDRKAAIAILQEYRTRDDIGEEARDCFKALLSIMDEIKDKYPVNQE